MISIPFRYKKYIRNLCFTPSFKMSNALREVPLGVIAIQKISSRCCPRLRFNKQVCYQTSILIITYLTYMCYHLSRKPISVVKNVLHYQNCSSFPRPPDVPANDTAWCDWVPFNGTDDEANKLLGELDLSFLIAYAIAMFFSGFIADRVNLRYFITMGMLFSGIFSYLFGIAKTYQIHNLSYFVFVQAAAGVFQTTGWPGVVAVVGKWFGKSKRGLIFGIWNSHTSIGNILGTLIAARFVEIDWSLSFIVPGLIIGLGSMVVFLFLVDEPQDVGLQSPSSAGVGSINTNHRDIYRSMESGRGYVSDDDATSTDHIDQPRVIIRGEQDESSKHATPPNESTSLLSHHTANRKAVGFFGALQIPGVIEFSVSLFFAKLVSYTFLYWLPFYIKNSTPLSATDSARLSVLFDVGGIIGAILAGILSDCTGMSASTCGVMLFLAAPMMMIYEIFGTLSYGMNVCLLLIVGLLVNGPYALITTAVSAELGTHSSIEGNSKALATVTAIIDGTGSIGAAIGPMLAALVSSKGWASVFYMLIACDFLALILLLRLIGHEIKRHYQHRSGPVE